jgi:hypothetical protein
MTSDNDFKVPVNEIQQRVIIMDGVRTTVCHNRFEIIVREGNVVYEQAAVTALRQWIKSRRQDEE